MAYILNLEHFADERGILTVIDKILPFEIKRTYYITGTNNLDRGGHRHLKLVEGILCLHGSFKVLIDDGITQQEVVMSNPHQCLILEVGEWHKFYDFTPDAVLFSLASTNYNAADYVYEPYKH